MPTVTFRLRNRVSGALSAPVSVDYTVTSLLAGMDAPNGAEFRAAVSQYPGMRYFREFGADGPDTDTLPELPSLTTGKFVEAPASAIPHVSWKDDVEQLSTWLDGLKRSIYLTWHHEPMGDVIPATYRSTAARVTQILAGHPNRRWILGHGPIVTRYWLDEKAGNPLDWWYDGATIYGIDCYQDTPSGAAYWGTTKMFGTVFNKVRYAIPGVRLLVPEYGITRLTSDTTGTGRAQAIRDHMAWLRLQQDVEAVAYFNSSLFPNYQIASASPEGQAWRDMQAL